MIKTTKSEMYKQVRAVRAAVEEIYGAVEASLVSLDADKGEIVFPVLGSRHGWRSEDIKTMTEDTVRAVLQAMEYDIWFSTINCHDSAIEGWEPEDWTGDQSCPD